MSDYLKIIMIVTNITYICRLYIIINSHLIFRLVAMTKQNFCPIYIYANITQKYYTHLDAALYA